MWDDQFQPFFRPEQQAAPFTAWIAGNRPLLMATFWLNYQAGALNPVGYHVANVLLHFFTSVLVTLVLARILAWSGVEGASRALLALFGGAIFLLHPLQTESVAYVTSRSEALSVLFFFAAYVVFLYRPPGPVTIGRILAIGALVAAALSTKEHTLTLPLLLLLTDLFWNPEGPRQNIALYATMALAGIAGGAYVLKILAASQSAGLNVNNLSPATYFFTQCRVIWRYIRLFVFPFGQNLDTEMPVSATLAEHGAIFGLLALAGLLWAAWRFRHRFPLASFGVFVFLLLIAPTSSIIPITDVVAERRVYLPFIGLVLVCLEPLRERAATTAIGTATVVLAMCAALTFQRCQLWSSPVALWQNTVKQSPNKVRPRFQLAYSYYNLGRCRDAVENFIATTRLAPPSQALLIDLGLSFSCSGRREEALRALEDATRVNPNYDMVYVYRGEVYEDLNQPEAASAEYARALEINPANAEAQAGLQRVTR